MSLRHDELARVLAELWPSLAGAAVQKAYAPRPRLVYLELWPAPDSAAAGNATRLCLSAEPGTTRLSVAPERSVRGEGTPLQRFLRGHVVGKRLTALTLDPADRIVRLGLGDGGPVLIAELRSPGGNLALLAPGGRVLALGDPSAAREGLRQGADYVPPGSVAPAAALSAREPRLEAEAASSRGSGPGPEPPFPLARAAESLLAGREVHRWSDAARKRLLGPLDAKLRRTRRTLEKIRVEAGRADEAERQRRTGELILQNLHLIEGGARRGSTAKQAPRASTVRVTEWTEEGAREVEVSIDPALGARGTAERCFHRYKRLLRGCEVAAEREARVAEELTALEAERARLAALADEEVMAAAPAPIGRRAPPQEARAFRSYRAGDGGPIWVGKGAAHNDTLTFRVARPHDVWLHARGEHGAHVVLPLGKKETPPQERLLDAAHLALHHSRLKGERWGEVSWVEVKRVRKPKGAPAGAVVYTHERTLAVSVEPDRLERLLASEEAAPAAR